MTKYVVLRFNGPGGSLSTVKNGLHFEASNDQEAIKLALAHVQGDPSGEYVAVPVRSFKPRKVEAKQAFSFS